MVEAGRANGDERKAGEQLFGHRRELGFERRREVVSVSCRNLALSLMFLASYRLEQLACSISVLQLFQTDLVVTIPPEHTLC